MTVSLGFITIEEPVIVPTIAIKTVAVSIRTSSSGISSNLPASSGMAAAWCEELGLEKGFELGMSPQLLGLKNGYPLEMTVT